jgi:uncharacterized protein YjbJ (UPF0337 family)
MSVFGAGSMARPDAPVGWCRFDFDEGVVSMGEKSEQAKGRVEEAVGDLTGDEHLQAEGRADRLAGEAKEALGHVKDKVEDVIDSVTGKLGHTKK